MKLLLLAMHPCALGAAVPAADVGVFTRPYGPTEYPFKTLAGDDRFVLETIRRVLQTRSPEFLEPGHGGTPCHVLLEQTQSDFVDFIVRLQQPGLRSFLQDWTKRLHRVLAEPRNLALRKLLEIDVRQESDVIKFVHPDLGIDGAPAEQYRIPPEMRAKDLWKGFGEAEIYSPEQKERPPGAPPEMFYTFVTRQTRPPMGSPGGAPLPPTAGPMIQYSYNTELPGQPEPGALSPWINAPAPTRRQNPEVVYKLLLALRDDYLSYRQKNFGVPAWPLETCRWYLVHAMNYLQKILELETLARLQDDPPTASHYLGLAVNFAAEARELLPIDRIHYRRYGTLQAEDYEYQVRVLAVQKLKE